MMDARGGAGSSPLPEDFSCCGRMGPSQAPLDFTVGVGRDKELSSGPNPVLSSSLCLPGLSFPDPKALSLTGFKFGPAASDSDWGTEPGGRVLPGALALGLPLAPASAAPQALGQASRGGQTGVGWG